MMIYALSKGEISSVGKKIRGKKYSSFNFFSAAVIMIKSYKTHFNFLGFKLFFTFSAFCCPVEIKGGL